MDRSHFSDISRQNLKPSSLKYFSIMIMIISVIFKMHMRVIQIQHFKGELRIDTFRKLCFMMLLYVEKLLDQLLVCQANYFMTKFLCDKFFKMAAIGSDKTR